LPAKGLRAPTSPVLTNAMMYSFDKIIADYCADNDMTYTRYADDLFVSTDAANALGEVYSLIRQAAQEFQFGDLNVNRRKTAFLSKKYRRKITGLVLTPTGNVSIGRARKREIKALVHQLLQGLIVGEQVEYLKGLLSFVSDVEPTFLNSLTRKYSNHFLWMLYHTQKTSPTSFAALEELDPTQESP
jgi:RNA-directed DNA polymerase